MTLRNNVIANYAGQGWAALMNLAFVPVYVARLGIESYALIGIYAALQAWLALLDLGMSPTLGREMARHAGGGLSATAVRDLVRSVEMICGGIGAAAATLMVAGSGFVADSWLNTHLPTGLVRTALCVMAVVVALRFLETIYRSALYGLERQVWFNAANMAVSTVRFGGAALVVTWLSPTIVAFFWWQLAVSVVAVALFRAKLLSCLPPGHRRARFSRAALVEVRRFAAGMFGINLASLVLTQADKVILSRALPLAAFGYYTLAFTMCSLVVAVTGPIVQASYPVLVRAHAEGDVDTFNRTYHRAAQLVAVAAASIAGVLAAGAPLVLAAWTGSSKTTAATAPLLAVLALGTLANSLMQPAYFGLLATGETRFPLRANIVAAATFVLTLLIVTPLAGAMAAACAWLALNIGFVIIGLPVLHKYHLRGLLSGWARADTGPALLAVGLVGLVIRLVAPSTEVNRLWLLAFLAASGGVALAGAVLATGPLRRLALHVALRQARRASLVTDKR